MKERNLTATAFPNGSSALLVHLTGTLPVNFRGSTYRFPMSIWVPHAYPREAPLIYVTPTATMMVRPGQHVDPQGQVYHPYLVGWVEFWDVCGTHEHVFHVCGAARLTNFLRNQPYTTSLLFSPTSLPKSLPSSPVRRNQHHHHHHKVPNPSHMSKAHHPDHLCLQRSHPELTAEAS